MNAIAKWTSGIFFPMGLAGARVVHQLLMEGREQENLRFPDRDKRR
jgi:hypothetical protein